MLNKSSLILVFFLALLGSQAIAEDEASSVYIAPKIPESKMAEKLDKLERNMVALQKEIYSGLGQTSTNPSALSPAYDAQFNEIYEQIKVLRGEIEQMQFELNKMNERFVKFSSDIEFRLNELAQMKSSNSGNKDLENIDEQLDEDTFLKGNDQKALEQKEKEEAAAKARANLSKTGEKTPEELYQEAYSSLKERDYDKSQKLFDLFITNYPSHEMIGSAHFWYGEIFHQKGEFDKAAVKYLKGYQLSPKGVRAPDNLLKLGDSLAKLKKFKEACLTLNKLKKEFPTASSSIKKKAEEHFTELKCK